MQIHKSFILFITATFLYFIRNLFGFWVGSKYNINKSELFNSVNFNIHLLNRIVQNDFVQILQS